MLGAEGQAATLWRAGTPLPTPSRFSLDPAAELVPGAQGHLETLMDSSKGPAGDKARHFSSAQALPEAPALPCTPTVGPAHPWVREPGAGRHLL